jgi:hypothetical protein
MRMSSNKFQVVYVPGGVPVPKDEVPKDEVSKDEVPKAVDIEINHCECESCTFQKYMRLGMMSYNIDSIIQCKCHKMLFGKN